MKLLALLLVAVLSAHAAKKPAAKAVKSLSLKALISTTMAKGEAMPLENPQSANLGYPAPQKVMDYVAGDPTKDTQLSSVVVLDEKQAPKELIFSSTTVTAWAGEQPTAIDGYSYRAKLSGELISGVRAYGAVGSVTQDITPINDTTKKHFKGLLSDIMRMAAQEKKK